MREDFDKVMRERGRYKNRYEGGVSRRRNQNLSIEDIQEAPNMPCYRKGGLMDSAAENFFRKNVGRKWDDVYSEVCAVNDIRSRPKPGIFEYIEYSVNLHPYIDEEGKVWGGKYMRMLSTFYVHPETGLLLEQKSQRYRRPKPPKDPVVVVDDYHQYRKDGDIWYLVTFADLDPDDSFSCKDIFEKKVYPVRPNVTAQNQYGSKIYAKSRKQANKKEIRWILEQLAKRRGED